MKFCDWISFYDFGLLLLIWFKRDFGCNNCVILLFVFWLLWIEFYFRGMLYLFNVLVGFDSVFFISWFLMIGLDLFCMSLGVVYV